MDLTLTLKSTLENKLRVQQLSWHCVMHENCKSINIWLGRCCQLHLNFVAGADILCNNMVGWHIGHSYHDQSISLSMWCHSPKWKIIHVMESLPPILLFWLAQCINNRCKIKWKFIEEMIQPSPLIKLFLGVCQPTWHGPDFTCNFPQTILRPTETDQSQIYPKLLLCFDSHLQVNISRCSSQHLSVISSKHCLCLQLELIPTRTAVRLKNPDYLGLKTQTLPDHSLKNVRWERKSHDFTM